MGRMRACLLLVQIFLASCASTMAPFSNALPHGPALEDIVTQRPNAPDRELPPSPDPFRVELVAPLDEIRCRIDGMGPPMSPAGTAEPDLVEPVRIDPRFRLDVRYATDRNFLGAPVYSVGRVYLQRPAAMALNRARARLEPLGFGLLLHDGYRPWRITKLFYEAVPPHQHAFVADPARGSRHNRGCAIDVSLFDLATGNPVACPSDYDAFTEAASPTFEGGSAMSRWRRDVLRAAMEAEGFYVNSKEWWHFDFADWERYPIMDVSFDELERR